MLLLKIEQNWVNRFIERIAENVYFLFPTLISIRFRLTFCLNNKFYERSSQVHGIIDYARKSID